MRGTPTIDFLVENVSSRIDLHWVAGQGGSSKVLEVPSDQEADQNLVGPLNFIHPNRVQLIGRAELGYLDGLGSSVRSESINRLLVTRPVAIVLTDNVHAPADLVRAADENATPLLATSASDSKALEHLQYYLSQHIAERATVHGVLMEVLGMGVLLSGDPAVGKSELALELLTRGHRLVADDAPELARIAPDILNGTCPPMLRDFLEVRGLGLLNVRAMFGESAIKRNKYLRLIIHLENLDAVHLGDMDRLTGSYSARSILGLDIPQVTVPVAPGRNMSILIETAVRNHMLRLKGYDAAEDFIERQRRAIDDEQA
ncbi:MAG: HPr(Ser) kinase/phosphatase [Pseudomonadota bacterium]